MSVSSFTSTLLIDPGWYSVQGTSSADEDVAGTDGLCESNHIC